MLFESVVFRKERYIDKIDLVGELFLVIKKRLNFIQVRIWRVVLCQANGINVVQELGQQQNVVVRRDVNRDSVYQALELGFKVLVELFFINIRRQKYHLIQLKTLGIWVVIQLMECQADQATAKTVCDNNYFLRFNVVADRLQQIYQMLRRTRYL